MFPGEEGEKNMLALRVNKLQSFFSSQPADGKEPNGG